MENKTDSVPLELKTYSVAEVAEIIGINTAKVYEYLRAGKLPHLKMGKARIRHQSLVKFLDEMETTQYWDSEVLANV